MKVLFSLKFAEWARAWDEIRLTCCRFYLYLHNNSENINQIRWFYVLFLFLRNVCKAYPWKRIEKKKESFLVPTSGHIIFVLCMISHIFFMLCRYVYRAFHPFSCRFNNAKVFLFLLFSYLFDTIEKVYGFSHD